MALRSLAKNQGQYMQFARVQYSEEDGAGWAKRFGFRVTPPCLVVLRGPGSAPQVGGQAHVCVAWLYACSMQDISSILCA